VHADYNGALLEDLLGRFKIAMGTNDAGEPFEPWVANTDNDTHEHHSLEHTWPLILLLLCLFHTWQSWCNGLNRHLRIIPKGNTCQKVHSHLGKFLMRLLKDITDYEEAIKAYNIELQYFKALGTGRTDILSKKASKGGLAFLAYLKTYLNIRGFWLPWSRAGTLEAARRLDIPFEKIARTTNHLESFNGRIKGKWFAPYIHSGRLPRIDHWILTMITKVMPSFFQEHTEHRQQHDYYLAMRYAAPVCSPRSNSDGDDQQEDEASSSVKPASEASVCEITAEIEVELLDQLQDGDDSGEAEDEEAEDEDVEEMEGYGMELPIEMASEVAADKSGSNIMANFFDCDKHSTVARSSTIYLATHLSCFPLHLHSLMLKIPLSTLWILTA
jgi:hypothetical protein